MIKKWFIFLLAAGMFQGVSMADESLTAILDGIQKTYGPLSGLTVTYTREVVTRSMSMLGGDMSGDTATGRIYFKHPDFLRLEQERPKPESIIASGNVLWWYIPEKKSAYRYPADHFGKELRLLSDIFRGLAQVENNFQVVLKGQTQTGGHEIELIPDPPWQEIDRIVVVATRQYEIRSIRILNTLGTTTHFSLGDLSEKKDFEEGFFQFVPPEGVTVITEGSGQ